MIQYIINVTAIWAVSLLAFDLLLRKDPAYNYSRAYLLSTLVLGLVLPTIHFALHNTISRQAIVLPMQQVFNARQVLTNVATPASGHVSTTLILLFIYLTGIAISLILILREVVRLASWYRQGQHITGGIYTIVVTGKEHSPFSVFKLIFITDRAAYSAEEMDYILSHEQQHIRSLHSWDKLFMLLVRTIFWVNPLVYIYYKRLMMVHEFEADAVAARNEGYGEFLIAMHLSGAYPSISHSINYSPLKTRIRMLTARQHRPWRKAAYAITLPIVAAFGLLWVNSTSAHQKQQSGNLITFNGNTIEVGMPMHNGKPASPEPLRLVLGGGRDNKVKDDRIVVSPAATTATKDAAEEEVIMVSLSPIPLKLNGEPVYDAQDLKQKLQLKGTKRSIFAEVIEKAAPVLSQLSDGKYMISAADLVVDKSGRVAYYDLGAIKWYTAPTPFSGSEKETMDIVNAKTKEREAHQVDPALAQRIADAVSDGLDALTFAPPKKDKQAVNVFTNEMRMQDQYIVVQNHKVSVVKAD